MADNTIDTLDIQINSSTAKAIRSLENLSKKLVSVNNALQSVNSGGLRNYTRDIGRVSAAIKSLNGAKIATPNLNGLSRQLSSISNVNFSAISGSSSALKDLASGLSSLSGLQNVSVPKIDTKNINSISSAIKKLENIDASKAQPVIDSVQKIAHSMSILNTIDLSQSKVIPGINAIRKLMDVNMDGFDPTALEKIAASIGSFANIPDTSSNLNRFMSSLQKLANSGGSIGNVANELPTLASALKNTVEKIASASMVSDSVNLFVQSLGRLASAGSKTGQTAGLLGDLAKETLNFFNVMKNAPKISENTVRMTQALADLANASGKVNSATDSISGAFTKLSSGTQKLGNLVEKTASKISSGIRTIIGWFQKLGSGSSGLKTASFNLGSLFKTAIGFKAIRSLADFGKSAIGLGSDITEVENVVDVAFGSMANNAYDFASTATEQFGLSELSAKQYSGTMMAMLKSSGVAQNAAAKMSTSLAGLAGDIASFYNLDTDTAFQKIRSGISGEIEPLRQLGINMSVANMEAYALSQGITTSYNAMTQAEKATLRYNYLMSVTGDMQGDFARTAGTWANQVRLLTLNFQSLSAVIGQGLIAGILPAIQALNALMNKLMQAAKAFRDFMYVLMGKKLKGSQSGVNTVVSDLGGIETAGNDAASGIDDATSSAKKLKKALSVLPFDELNQLTDNSNDSGTSSKSLGSGLGDLADTFSGLQDSLDDVLTVDETPINKWATKIRKAFLDKDWVGLGNTIGDMVNTGMQKLYNVISWDNVGPKITAFTSAFTTAFNALNTAIDFDLLGRTIGSGINTAVKTLNQLIGDGGIDFKQIGTNIASALKGAIEEIDWNDLGKLLGNKFMASWKMLSGFIEEMSQEDDAGITGWDKLGTALGNALNGMISTISMTDIADALSGLLNGAFDSLAAFTKTVNWQDLADNISGGISTFLKNTNWKENGAALGNFISNLCTALRSVLTKDTFYEFGKDVGEFLGELPWGEILETAADLLLTGLTSALRGLFDGLEEKHPIAGKIAEWLTDAFIAVKILDISGIGTLIGKLVSHIGEKIVEEKNAELIADKLSSVLGDGTSGAKEAIKDLGDEAEAAGNGGFTTLAEKIKNLGDVAQTAGGQFQGFWGYATNLGATAFVMEGLGQVKKAMDFKDSTADAFNDFEVVRKALKIVEDQTGISSDKFIGLGGDLKNVKDNAFDFDEQLQTVETSLENLGISSDTFKQALKQAMEESDTSTNSHASNINKYIGTMGTEFDNAKSALERLSNQAVITPTQFDELSTVLQQQESSGATARAAFQALMDKMAEMGIDTGKVIKAFSEDVPKASSTMSKSVATATQSVSSNSKTGFGAASAAASGALSGIQKLAETSMSSTETSFKNATSNIKTDSQTNWSDSAGSVTTALGTMDTDTKDVMGRVMSTIQSYWSSVLINTNQIWEKVSIKVGNELGNMENYVGGFIGAVQNNFSGMYDIGRNAMQQLANGIYSVYIKTPHMYMDMSVSSNGTNRSYKWNSGISWYAKGGLFNGAHVIGVGEAGQEAVLPLENPRAMKKIAESIVSSSDGSMGLTAEELTQAVTQGVAMAMSMNHGGGSQNPQYIVNSIVVDGSEIAKVVTKAQNDTNSRFNPSPAY